MTVSIKFYERFKNPIYSILGHTATSVTFHEATNLFFQPLLTLYSIYTHFNTLKKKALGKHFDKR